MRLQFIEELVILSVKSNSNLITIHSVKSIDPMRETFFHRRANYLALKIMRVIII